MKSQTRATATWKEIKPFAIRDIGSMMEQAKSSSQQEGYFIILYDESGQNLKFYSMSIEGLDAALNAAESGDIVFIPAGTIVGSYSPTIYSSLTTNTKASSLGEGNSGNDPPEGWNTVEYDDSGWGYAILGNDPTSLVTVDPADPLWMAVAKNYRLVFRHKFTPHAGATQAILLWDADDWTNGIYVNGELVDQWLSGVGGDDHPAREVDITDLVNFGSENVICIDQYDSEAVAANQCSVSWIVTVNTNETITIPSGVEIVGLGKNSILDADIVNSGILTNIKVTGTITGAGICRMIPNPTAELFSSQIKSLLETGTSPFSIQSTTVNTNLNADLLDGQHASEFAASSHTHTESDVTDLDHDAAKIDGVPVDLTGIADGEVLEYDVYTGTIVPGAGGGGAGDMTKAVYDADADDVVDEAAAVEGVDAAGNSKYYGTNGAGTPGFYDLPSGAEDTAAIHDDESGEIHAITEKTTPVDDDELLIEDSAASYVKKRLKISNLPAGGGAFSTGDIQMVELYRSTLGVAGRFDFSSIPQTYDHLLVEMIVKTSEAAATNGNDTGNLFFNNDTTASNYRSLGAWDSYNASGRTIGDSSSFYVVNSYEANYYKVVRLFIPFYATGFYKYANFDARGRHPGDGFLIHLGQISWESNAAINQITIQPDGYDTDKFVAGCICIIYGVKTTA